MKETTEQKKQRAKKILALLKKEYPRAKTALRHKNPFQLLVATILSAQCTDKQVNKVTPSLFSKYKTPQDFAHAPLEELQHAIRSIGFFRNKAKNIKVASAMLNSEFEGKIPRTMEEILKLPGVARKTANVVLGQAYGIAEGIVVDTHIFRVSRRMGLSDGKNPQAVEKDVMQLLPQKDWIAYGDTVILHGRAACTARHAYCEECRIEKLCLKEKLLKSFQRKHPQVFVLNALTKVRKQ